MSSATPKETTAPQSSCIFFQTLNLEPTDVYISLHSSNLNTLTVNEVSSLDQIEFRNVALHSEAKDIGSRQS